MSDDVGRRFRVTRTISMEFDLSEDDVRDQEEAGETAYESAVIIAGSSPLDSWNIDDEMVEELV